MTQAKLKVKKGDEKHNHGRFFNAHNIEQAKNNHRQNRHYNDV